MTNANATRCTFPGFVSKQDKDTLSHLAEVGTIEHEGNVFVLEMIKKRGLPEQVPFVVARIDNSEGKNLWNFKQENFDGAGVLALAGKEPVIALVGKGRAGKLERVIQLTKLGTTIQPDLKRQVIRKREAAKFLGRECSLTQAEMLVAQVIDGRPEVVKEFKARIERRKKEDAVLKPILDADKVERQVAHEARVAARKERIAKIMSRDEISVQTFKGGKCFGVPVLASEWPSLDNGTFVVLVESIDENGIPSGFIEAFQVKKGGGKNAVKEFVTPVTAISATEATQVSIEPTGIAVIQREGSFFEVKLFAGMGNIHAAQKSGLNGGTFVAVGNLNGDTLEVFSVTSKELTPVGKFAQLAQ